MAESLITQHIDLWTSAIEAKSTVGRGSSNKFDLYGIKKLRELILELAVRGKLVPHDPNDEPASLLFERIQKDVIARVESGEIKKLKTFEPINMLELQYEVPNLWIPIRLGQIFNVVYGKGLSTAELKSEGYPVFGANGVIGFFDSYNYENEQLLISCRGAYSGKPNISPEKCFVTSNSLVLESNWSFLYQKYFYYALTIANKSQIVTGSAQPQVTTTNLDPFVILLPPLKQQHKIVSKIDEIMALCDQLEQQTLTSIDAHATLVETLLETLTNSADTAELEQNWARISEHFDTLFTTEQSIDALKQTILQLAVMGKLVRQDPADEPASVLLEKIAAEKAQLIKDKKIKKEKPLPPISDDEKPFELPKGWEWCRIGNAAISTDYGLSEKTFKSNEGVPVLKMGDIQSGTVVLGRQEKVPSSTEGLPDLYLKNDDLLYNRTNSAELVGKTGIYKGKDDAFTFASYLIRIRTIKNNVFPDFINMNMCSPLFRVHQINPLIKQQCGQANVNGTFMKNMLVAIAPENEQKRIVDKNILLQNICDVLRMKIRESNYMQRIISELVVSEISND